jgi:hypothetical protein
MCLGSLLPPRYNRLLGRFRYPHLDYGLSRNLNRFTRCGIATHTSFPFNQDQLSDPRKGTSRMASWMPGVYLKEKREARQKFGGKFGLLTCPVAFYTIPPKSTSRRSCRFSSIEIKWGGGATVEHYFWLFKETDLWPALSAGSKSLRPVREIQARNSSWQEGVGSLRQAGPGSYSQEGFSLIPGTNRGNRGCS